MEKRNLKKIVLNYRTIGILIAFFYFILLFFTLNDYGITWDEPRHYDSSEKYLDFFRYGDTDAWNLNNSNRLYPPSAKIFSTITWWSFHEKLSWLDSLSAHRLPIPILAGLTVLLVYFFCLKFYGPKVAIFSSLFLIFFPRFFAHSHYNIKDIPFTFFYVLTLFALLKGGILNKTRNLKWLLISGISFGLALGVRLFALFIPVVLITWFILVFRERIKIKKEVYLPHPFMSLIFCCIIGLITFVLIWPFLWPWLWGWKLSFIHLLQYFVAYTREIYMKIFYLGKVYSVNDVPWHYPFVQLLITTPILTLIFMGIGIYFWLTNKTNIHKKLTLLLLIWLFFSLAKESIPGVNVYDGIRHFLDILPPLCILAGIGATGTYNILTKKLANYKNFCFILMIFLIFIPTFVAIMKLHPYESSYYNSFVGGVSGADKNFEIEYWGGPYKASTEWLNKHAENESIISVGIASHIPKYYARPDLEFSSINKVYDIKNVDYVMFINRKGFYNEGVSYCLENLNPIHVVTADGAPLAFTYKITEGVKNNISVEEPSEEIQKTTTVIDLNTICDKIQNQQEKDECYRCGEISSLSSRSMCYMLFA